MQNDAVGGAPPPSAPEKPAARRIRTPTKFPLPSERFPFGRHFEVLDRFMAVSRNGKEAVNAASVEGEGLPAQSAQLSTGFLTSIGLLEEPERGKFKPSAEAMRFLMTKSVSEDRARPILRGLIDNSWFADAARSLLAKRNTVTDEDLRTELALVAGTHGERKADALRILIEYLLYAGIVQRTDLGLVLAWSGPGGVVPVPAIPPSPMPESLIIRPQPGGQGIAPSGMVPVPGSGVTVRWGIGVLPPAPEPEWRVIQTNDFFVKIRPDPMAVADLRDHLDLLDRRLKAAPRIGGSAPPPEAKP